MHWLSSPRVRLGLLVNGLYLLSLFTQTPPQRTRACTFVRSSGCDTGRLCSTSPPEYAPLAPQTGALKAKRDYRLESGQYRISLTRDLLLARERGYTLLLSPMYYTEVLNERPFSVVMLFTSYSHEQHYDGDSAFVINADGVEVWRSGQRGPGDETPWHARALHSAKLDENNQVFETFGQEIPNDIFARMARARRVTFELGPDTVKLTTEQLAALREMSILLPHTSPPPPGADYNIPYSKPNRNY